MSPRIVIDRCPLDCMDQATALEALLAALDGGPHQCVAPVNAYTVVEAHRNPDLCAALARMTLAVPDGFWLQPAARLTRQAPTGHVAVVRLTFRLLERLAARGGRVYLLGARPEVVAEAAARVVQRFPGVIVVGSRDGYFTEADEEKIISDINAARPDLLMVGIASPKRDLFMARRRDDFDVPVTIGVGGLIDILGGKTAEGPDWLRQIGMMWLYRFMQEPRRMWRRYTSTNLLFIAYVLRHAFLGPPAPHACANLIHPQTKGATHD